ncbi:hypothetical protein [Piscinibacter defluvii]|uniref:hypothetical protein n=1 Tax=Piscinibacter defluvii TaxID=1796922 RepID=UPI000FDD5BF8|nr:hypothetical protein [Piscinibacter defluvii]
MTKAAKTVPALADAPAALERAREAYEELNDYVERLAAMALTIEGNLARLADEKEGNLPVVIEWRLAQVMADMLGDPEVLRGIRVSLGIEDPRTGAAKPFEATA